MQIQDHPDIRAAERMGFGKFSSNPICPVCGAECETLYKDKWGDVIGCEDCVTAVEAWEENDE